MTYYLWQADSATPPPTLTVHADPDEQVPNELRILVSLNAQQDMTGASHYMQFAVPGAGPVLAWVGVPGGAERMGHFVHPASGRTWPWKQLREAVRYATGHG